MKYKFTEEQFFKDIHNHVLAIDKDDGLYRHLVFSRPDSWVFKFMITTWPGYLCISGDMGCYVFTRIEDMFEFFRMDENDFMRQEEKKLQVNPAYWGEKCVAECVISKMKEFDSDLVLENVQCYFDTYFEDTENIEEKEAVWQEIESQILSAGTSEYEIFSAIQNFTTCGIDTAFTFVDFWECSYMTKTYRFMWCLHAISYAVREYDNHKIKS